MAAGLAGVLREAARLPNSFEVFADWSLTLWATGPEGEDSGQYLTMRHKDVMGGRHGEIKRTGSNLLVSSGSV